MRRGLFASIIGVIALVGSVGSVGRVGSVANASASTNPTPLQYVALGNSYSAGSGVLPPDPSAPVECLRSSRNKPVVLFQLKEPRQGIRDPWQRATGGPRRHLGPEPHGPRATARRVTAQGR